MKRVLQIMIIVKINLSQRNWLQKVKDGEGEGKGKHFYPLSSLQVSSLTSLCFTYASSINFTTMIPQTRRQLRMPDEFYQHLAEGGGL